jgi:hypothetical protein
MNFLHLLQLQEAEKKELMENLFKTEQIELKTIQVRKDKATVPIQLRLSLLKTAHGKLIISVIHKT